MTIRNFLGAARKAVLSAIFASLSLCLDAPGNAAEGQQGWQWKLELTSVGTPVRDDVLELRPGAPPPSLLHLRVIERRRIDGRPAGDRRLAPAEGQIIIVARSAKGAILWHKMIPDPRLVRAEPVGPNRAFKGRKQFVRKTVEFTVQVPDDPAIDRIEVVEPRWTGREFVLAPLGTLGVR